MVKKALLSIFLLVLGAVTLFMSSSVIFDWFGIRSREGNFVPAVVWANWTCGILYIASSVALMKRKIWTKGLLITALAILILASFYLSVHVSTGGLYETKTIGALAFRTVITALLLILTRNMIKR